MTNYRKSRKSYPNGILLITDIGHKQFDRYSVYYEPYEHHNQMVFPYVSMSEYPYSSQGYGEHGELNFRYSVWGTNEKILNFGNLPIDCQKLVRQDLKEREV